MKIFFTGAPLVHRWCGEIVKYLTLIVGYFYDPCLIRFAIIKPVCLCLCTTAVPEEEAEEEPGLVAVQVGRRGRAAGPAVAKR